MGKQWIHIASAGTSTGSGGAGITGVTISDKTLTVATTTISGPATVAGLLIVILRQDGTGGRQIAWASGQFSAVPATLTDTTASTIAVFVFAASGGKWVMCAQPTQGMTP